MSHLADFLTTDPVNRCGRVSEASQTAATGVAPLALALFTLVSVIIARYSAILFHEWSHSTMAWFFGVFPAANPLAIHYGDWTLLEANALAFSHMSETAFYTSLMQNGMNLQAVTIAMAGPSMNILLAILCFAVIWCSFTKGHPFAATFVFWVFVFNFGAVWAFALLRVFSIHSDIGYIETATGVPPLIIFVPAVLIVVAAVGLLFLLLIPRYFQQAGITGKRLKQAIVVLVFLILWLYYTILPSGILDDGTGTINGVMGVTGSLILVICVFMAGKRVSAASG
ncbi:MAG: hypothetical protein Q7V05_16090 [Methanoregula sp.]|nr:hypothetical protein [Methanoregula sp.]